MKNNAFEEYDLDLPEELEPLRGHNFLVSAVMILKKQKQDLAKENQQLKSQIEHLQAHNARLLDISADRLLEKLV